jgi:hypothetical protein
MEDVSWSETGILYRLCRHLLLLLLLLLLLGLIGRLQLWLTLRAWLPAAASRTVSMAFSSNTPWRHHCSAAQHTAGNKAWASASSVQEGGGGSKRKRVQGRSPARAGRYWSEGQEVALVEAKGGPQPACTAGRQGSKKQACDRSNKQLISKITYWRQVAAAAGWHAAVLCQLLVHVEQGLGRAAPRGYTKGQPHGIAGLVVGVLS